VSDYIDSLERLAGLFQKGILSKEEFDAEKAKLLSNSRDDTSKERKFLAKAFDTRQKRIVALAGLAILCGLALGAVVWKDITADAATQNELSASAPEANRQPDPVSPIIDFADLSGCKPGQNLAGLLGRIRESAAATRSGDQVVYLAGTAKAAGVGSHTDNSVGRTVQLAGIRISTRWLGLNVTQLKALDFSDGSGVEIDIAEAPQQVAQVLAMNGVPELLAGKIHEESSALHAVEGYGGGGSAYTCILVRSTNEKSNDQSDTGDE
jgi:hypothetical protein